MEKVEKFIPKKVPEKETPEGEEKLPPNVVMVETEKAKFRIAYGAHITERKPEELGKSNAWVLETSSRLDYTLSKEIVEKDFNKLLRKSRDYFYLKEYEKIFEKAEKEKIPIFLADIAVKDTATLLQEVLTNLEAGVGFGLLSILAIDIAEVITGEKKLNRREFLKKAGAGIYFLSYLPGSMIRDLFGKDFILDEKSASRAVERFLADLNERIHPETNAIIVSLRNSLLAQKAKTIAEKLEIEERKPEIAITVGPGHHRIENALLKEDEERVWLIDKLLSIPGLKKTREKIATIARFDFNQEEGKWKLTDRFKDPHLAKIEK